MAGNNQRMPKKARYPLFIIGLAIIILGSIVANFKGAGASSIGVIVLVGFALLILSVAIP
jgi:uncharacterized membrane protein